MRETCTSGLTRGAANPPLLYNLNRCKNEPRNEPRIVRTEPRGGRSWTRRALHWTAITPLPLYSITPLLPSSSACTARFMERSLKISRLNTYKG